MERLQELKQRLELNEYSEDDIVRAIEVIDSNLKWLLSGEVFDGSTVNARLETRAGLINQLPESELKTYLKQNPPQESNL